jgi:hypothetical protein
VSHSSSKEGAAAAELALKAHILRSNPEILAEMSERDRIMQEIVDTVDLTEAPEDAVSSLVIDKDEEQRRLFIEYNGARWRIILVTRRWSYGD